MGGQLRGQTGLCNQKAAKNQFFKNDTFSLCRHFSICLKILTLQEAVIFFCDAILTAQILGAAKMQQLQKNGEPT